jgi:hypothetical protein
MQNAFWVEEEVTRHYICEHKSNSDLILPDLASKWLALKAKILEFGPNKLNGES